MKMELKHSHSKPKKILHYLINLFLQNKTDIISLKYLSSYETKFNIFIHHSTDAKHELISRFLHTKVQ